MEILRDRGKDEQTAKVERAAKSIHPVAVAQEKPLDLEHTGGLAESVLDDDEHCFAVMLPDDVIEPTVAMNEMIWVRQEHGGSVLLAVEVDPAHVSSCSVFDIETTDDDRVKKVVGMVEKPAAEDAPSNFVATGRYLLDRAIFGALRRITPGKGGGTCSSLTPSLSSSPRGTPSMSWFMRGAVMTLTTRPASFRPVLNFGLRHPKYGPALFRDLEAIMEKYRPELG